MEMTIRNGILPSGRVTLPPSKSEAIRAALLIGLAGGDPRLAVAGYPEPYCGDLCDALLAAKEVKSAYVGESAALMRFLIPIQAVRWGRVSISADEVLYRRGYAEIEDCLGVSLAPIPGTTLIHKRVRLGRKNRFEIDCSRSSQFLSGLLMALPLMKRDCEILLKTPQVSKPYSDMTLDFVRLFGGKVEETETGYITHPSRYAVPGEIPVTGDASYAAVFEAMDLLGASVEISGKSAASRQPDADFLRLAGLNECDVTHCPDLAPLLAAAACGRAGDTVIRGTARLRTKESDRQSGTVRLIRALGGRAEAGSDSITVHGTGTLSGGTADPMGDHRLCFAAAVMALISRGPVRIINAECVSKSAPGFWDELARLTE